jgi:hypothetical protein
MRLSIQSELPKMNLYNDADFLLWLRSRINEHKLDPYDNWHLRDPLRHLDSVVMARCASTMYGNRLARVLGYPDLEQLRNRIESEFGKELDKLFGPSYLDTNLSKLLMFEEWGSQP